MRALRSPTSTMGTWVRGAGWILISSLVERGAALIQTILFARAIGIEDYGRYALLFSTIGMLTPIVSLQLSYAIIVQVSRHRDGDDAGAIVLLAEWLTNASIAILLLIALAIPSTLSEWLFADSGYRTPIILGAILLVLTVKSGLYDCVLQASDAFRRLSLARAISSLVTLALIAAIAFRGGGLTSLLGALAVGGLLRMLAVALPARSIARRLKGNVPFSQAWRKLNVILYFSLPSGLMSLGLGYATWLGNYYLARDTHNLRDLAVLNTAVQWRSPILMIMAALATTLLPMLGRSIARGDGVATSRLVKYNMILTLGLSITMCLAMVLFAVPLLALYGPSFGERRTIFILFLIPLIFMVYCNSHQQYLVAHGRLWTQLLAYFPLFLINIVGAYAFRRSLNGEMLAYIQIAGWAATSVVLGIMAASPLAWRPGRFDKWRRADR